MNHVSSYLSHCTQYLVTEQRCAGESFVIDLCAFVGKPGLARKAWEMAAQLMAQPRFYFPNFEQMATAKYLDLLANVDDVRRLRSSGLVLFAVAHLPGARTDMRRIFRRRGIDGAEDYIPTLVADETMTQRIRAVQGLAPVGKARKRLQKRPS